MPGKLGQQRGSLPGMGIAKILETVVKPVTRGVILKKRDYGECSQVVKAVDCGSTIRGFEFPSPRPGFRGCLFQSGHSTGHIFTQFLWITDDKSVVVRISMGQFK